MVRFLLSLRYVTLLASLGALVGTGLMWGLAVVKLARGAQALLAGEVDAGEITAAVMGAIDALLFGVVLLIFAYAIAFGFALGARAGDKVPAWMRPHGIGELKRILVEVILVYLIVDFATDLAQEGAHPAWTHLVVPLSVLLIAGAMRLLPHAAPPEHGTDRSPADSPP